MNLWCMDYTSQLFQVGFGRRIEKVVYNGFPVLWLANVAVEAKCGDVFSRMSQILAVAATQHAHIGKAGQ